MRIRSLIGCVGLVLAGLCAPTAAHAVSIDVTCAGTETVSYSPGLLLTTQTVRTSVTGSLAACSSSDPGITAGTYREDFSASLSCATLLSGRAGTRIFRWSDGTTSTFAFNRALNNAAGQVTVTFSGSITAGRFTGDTVLEQVVFVTPNPLQCLASPGLTTLGPGPVVLSISQL